MKFGKMNYFETLTFIEELEEENDTKLDFYKEKIENHNEDEFELTYYGDRENWSLENITEHEVVIDKEVFDLCLEEDQ